MATAFNPDYSTNDRNSSARSPEERLAEATTFLTAHFGHLRSDERFAINTFDNERNRKKHPERNIPVQKFSHEEFTADQIDAAAQYAIDLSKTHDVYVSMAVVGGDTVGLRFSKASVTGGYLLWAEIDYEAGKDAHQGENLPPSLNDSLSIPDAFGVAPSEIVHSGHGIHCYWFLDTFLSRDELAKMELALMSAIKGYAQQRGWKVDSIFDVARVLRIPGTLNHKRWPVLSVATYLTQTEQRYPVDTLIDAIERAPKPVAKLGMKDFDAKAITERKPLDASDEAIIWETRNPSRLRRWLGGDSSDQKGDISGTEWAVARDLADVGANMEQIDRIIGSSPLETERKDKPGKWWEKGHSAEYPDLKYGQLTAMRAIAKGEDDRADPETIAWVNATLGIAAGDDADVDVDTSEDTTEAAEQPVATPVAAETTSDTPEIIAAPTAAKVIDMAVAVPSITKERTTREADESNTVTEPISIEEKRKEREGDQKKADRYYPCSDEGNARRFADLFKDRLRYLPSREQWFVYDGTRWAPDEKLEHLKLARTISEEVARDAKKLEERANEVIALADPERKDEVETLQKNAKALYAWAKQSQAKARIDAAANLARSDLALREGQLDTHHNWLNVKNGTLDLMTGVLMAHSRDHYLTRIGAANYNPQAQAPTWQQFLDAFTNKNTDVQAYLQRAVGYSLLGMPEDGGEEKMFVLYGDGSNGKSTFFNAIGNAIGGFEGDGYAHAMRARALMMNSDSGSGATPDIVKLKGTRFVTARESNKGAQFDEEQVKSIVSRDPKTGRDLHTSLITFMPTHTVWLATNYKPEIPGRSYGIWRRLVLIKLNGTFKEEREVREEAVKYYQRGGLENPTEADISDLIQEWRHDDYEDGSTNRLLVIDKTLTARLEAEAEGILAWAVEGCREYLRIGLAEPDDIRKHTESWKFEGDDIADFIELYLIPAPKHTISRQQMRDMFVEYWENSHAFGGEVKYKVPSTVDMKQELERKGVRIGKSGDVRVYRDWRVKTFEEFTALHGDVYSRSTWCRRLEKWQPRKSV